MAGVWCRLSPVRAISLTVAVLFSAVLSADANTQYILGSFPGLRQVLYVTTPDLTWRPLIVSGIIEPEAIAVDKLNSRLFVVDSPALKIYWYQLIVLPDGKLITDGRQHVAVESVAAKYVAVDTVGNLYFTGKLSVLPPMTSEEGLFKQDTIALATGVTINPVSLWSKSSTEERLFMPSGLSVSAFNIYWANSASGKAKGSVVKAPTTPPSVSAAASLKPLADNEDEVMALALTPNNIFYATTNGIYGVPTSKTTSTCSANPVDCVRVTTTASKPTSMIWDGDGTIYVAGNKKGKLFAFASSAIQGDISMRTVVAAPGIWGVDLLTIASGAAARGSALLFAAVIGIFSLSTLQ